MKPRGVLFVKIDGKEYLVEGPITCRKGGPTTERLDGMEDETLQGTNRIKQELQNVSPGMSPLLTVATRDRQKLLEEIDALRKRVIEEQAKDHPLAPCPYPGCGAAARALKVDGHYRGTTVYYVECDRRECGARGPVVNSEIEARVAWNMVADPKK